MKLYKLISVVMVIFLSACATQGPTMTPLEIQSMQTREYEQDKDIVFPSVMSVFQDLGYTVSTASKDTGLITASSASNSSAASKFWLGVTDVSQTKATAFIEEIGVITKVRLSFVNTSKRSSAYGQSDQQDTPVLDTGAYQNAFERIENAIFIRSSN
ncbi:MAG: hypothetical protein A6F72_02730 [Cycloclasticus sp. symbiont of Poecilosclerida sp. N]|nr:MAG: hypothetical protein A6F72_02730 [Cycloclasticus sp. symbiont of Poecilosclerida sp. N]